MAVSYAPTKLRVPPGFQNLLEGLAREVLREQPEDIISFAAQYFKNKLVLREETGKDDAKRGEQLEKLMKGEDVDLDPNDPNIHAAATKIQASFRGHKTREDIKKHREEEEAALKIQATFRGHVTREQVKEMKMSQSREKVEQAETGGEKVTTDAPRDDRAEKEQAEELDIDPNDPDVQDAAVKIQASFRGHKAREEVKAMKSGADEGADKTEGAPAGVEQDSEVQPEVQQTTAEGATPQDASEDIDIDLEDPEVKKAASKIQASFRGKFGKKKASNDDVTQSTDGGLQAESDAKVESQETSSEVPAEQSQEPAESPQAEQSQEPEEASQEPAESSQQPAESSQELEESSQEPVEQTQEPEEPSQEAAEQSQEAAEQSQEPEEPSEQTQEPEEPSEEPVEQTQEPEEPSQEEPEEASQEPVEQTQEPEEPAAEQSQEPEEASQEPAEQSQEPEVPSQETAEQSQDPAGSQDARLMSVSQEDEGGP